MSSNNNNLANNPLVVLISVIAGIFAIIAFVSGRDNLPDLIKALNPPATPHLSNQETPTLIPSTPIVDLVTPVVEQATAIDTSILDDLDVSGEWSGKTSQGHDISITIDKDTKGYYVRDIRLNFQYDTIISGECPDILTVPGWGIPENYITSPQFDVNIRNSEGHTTNLFGIRGNFISRNRMKGTFYLDFDSFHIEPYNCRAAAEVDFSVLK